jgi:dipeptidyl aminopeptidase/acylaminoacyl peptidase
MQNKHFLTIALSVFALAGGVSVSHAQGTMEDYVRAYTLQNKFSRDKVYHWAQFVQWKDSSSVLYYQVNTADGPLYVSYDAAKKTRKTYADEASMNKALGLEARRPGFPGMRPGMGGGKFEPAEKHWMVVDEETDQFPVLSPDGKTEAYIDGQNLTIHEVGTPYSEARALSTDGTLGCYYSNQILWSPDGNYIFVCKRRPVPKRYAYYVESSPEGQVQPILHKQEYAKPGDELPQHYPVIFNVKTGEKVEADKAALDNQYELGYYEWTPDSKEVTFEYNKRGHQLYQLLAMDASTGALRTVVEETADTYVNWTRIWRQFISGGKELLWTSERDNWNHLYLVDVAKGVSAEPKLITKGDWCLREIVNVDEKARRVTFTASGMNPGEDPYFIHYYSIGLDGKNLVSLTPAEGNHRATFSPDGKWIVDSYSMVDKAPVTELRRVSDGKLVETLETADLSALEAAGWRAPERFTAPGRDGKTLMYGNIVRPSNFDPSKKYPVIEYIYSGPGDAYTRKDFTPYDYSMSSLAELGFIVVQLDGMGTSWRGKKFEEICYKNLKDSGFLDRKAWIRAAAEKYPYMDADNVGVFGCSAGGQEAAAAVIFHGDFYKAAYAACGCHDNRMDKIWWNEQWMGWPLDKSYEECSNVVNAWRLERPLMLVVGELDDNVDPSTTFQVVNALEKAGKDFELLVITGAHHTMGEEFGDHKRYDFFVRNLLGENPPKWGELDKALKNN